MQNKYFHLDWIAKLQPREGSYPFSFPDTVLDNADTTSPTCPILRSIVCLLSPPS